MSDENYKLSRLKSGISRIAEAMHRANTDEINNASNMHSSVSFRFGIIMIASGKRPEEF